MAQNNANNGNNSQGVTQWKTNGNIADSAHYIGTKNEFPVKFRSYDIERMRISPEGNVGIGTKNPQARLDVNGKVIIRNGELLLNYVKDSTLLSDEVLLIDSTGAVKRGGDLKSLVYKDYIDPSFKPCKDANFGYTTPASPTWANGPGKIYTTSQCVPDVKVGIGMNNPQSKLHIKLNDQAPGINTHALIVEKGDGEKILQLTENGVLFAREIQVDLVSWPDYVFESNYSLMPLSDVKNFIRVNGHLPKVPSACEIEIDGLNLGEMDKILMEKVEELTLYMIQLQEQVKKQEELLKSQQVLIENLRETTKN